MTYYGNSFFCIDENDDLYSIFIPCSVYTKKTTIVRDK